MFCPSWLCCCLFLMNSSSWAHWACTFFWWVSMDCGLISIWPLRRMKTRYSRDVPQIENIPYLVHDLQGLKLTKEPYGYAATLNTGGKSLQINVSKNKVYVKNTDLKYLFITFLLNSDCASEKNMTTKLLRKTDVLNVFYKYTTLHAKDFVMRS